jgi:hypothetical protein
MPFSGPGTGEDGLAFVRVAVRLERDAGTIHAGLLTNGVLSQASACGIRARWFIVAAARPWSAVNHPECANPSRRFWTLHLPAGMDDWLTAYARAARQLFNIRPGDGIDPEQHAACAAIADQEAPLQG